MPSYDFRSPRLFVEAPLLARAHLPLERPQAHYLTAVMRLSAGAELLAFNGRDGEWLARLAVAGKREIALDVVERVREQPARPDLHYLFAPLKHARLDYLVQKAVEMGAGRLVPVITQRTQVERVNGPRMRANAIEAAEQCGVLYIPEIVEAAKLDRAIAELGAERVLVFCDEAAPVKDPLAALAEAVPSRTRPAPVALLIGPEGGFTEAERAAVLARAGVVRLALGPRILRADTAAVAALALVGAVLGDWR